MKTKIIQKIPTQHRSRQTVSWILQSCTELLLEEGFYNLTTDKIAERAKVSIGSLYQFFGNKESVVQAIVKNLIDEDKRVFIEGAALITDLPLQEKIEAIAKLGLKIKLRDSFLRAKLTTVQYYVSDTSYISESIQTFKQVLIQLLNPHTQKDIDVPCYLVTCSFIGLANTVAIDAPNNLQDQRVQNEIVRMYSSYIQSML